jgi:hypothetical protein
MTLPEEGSIKFRVQQAKTWDMLSLTKEGAVWGASTGEQQGR